MILDNEITDNFAGVLVLGGGPGVKVKDSVIDGNMV